MAVFLLPLLSVLLLALGRPCLAVTTTVLQPRDGTSGTPAGLLILPGAFLQGEQYRKTGEAVQAASSQRLWVGLSGGFSLDMVNPVEMPEALEDGVRKLRAAGLPVDAPIFAAGHSLAGVFLPGPALEQAGLKGLFMWASSLPDGDLVKYQLPVMTLSGEMDGQTRVTKILKSYREVEDEVSEKTQPSLRLKYPVVVLSEVNHAHFASGKMPPLVEQEDIKSPLDEAEAKKRIAAVTAAFISYHTNNDAASQRRLEQAWGTTTTIVKPFLTLSDEELSRDKKSSPWVTQAQTIISTLGQTDLALVDIDNTVYESDVDFPISKPEVEVRDGRLVINTTANVKYGPTVTAILPQMATEIEAKMKRMEALKQEADRAGLKLNFGSAVSCKEANMAALERALAQASEAARKRYNARNIRVQFEDDELVATGPGFLLGELTFKLEGGVLTIKSVSLVTDLDVILGVAGMHYCKLLSPARALEFIYIDSLKKESPSASLRTRP